MDQPVLSLQHVSKKFCRSLKRSLFYGLRDLASEMTLRQRERDVLRRDEFWALKDVSFGVRKGETLGLVGHNGAGKSTLLKLINGLIRPDVGRVSTTGRVGALIELGTGFHPVLSGRENIYVNAAILGLSRKETERRFDDILAFAEIGEFIDAPVQSYSSGMKVRLGFSIAAHLDPEVLLIDEILSVGDASFRQRCLDRLSEYKRGGGTVIFVSHNPTAIEAICDQALLLDHGRVIDIGKPADILLRYERDVMDQNRRPDRLQKTQPVTGTQCISISDVQCLSAAGEPRTEFDFGESFEVRFRFETMDDLPSPHFTIGIQKEARQNPFASMMTMLWDGIHLKAVPRRGTISCSINAPPLSPGLYRLYLGVQSEHISALMGEKWYLPLGEFASVVIRPGEVWDVLPGVPVSNVSTMPPLVLDHSWSFNGQPLPHDTVTACDELREEVEEPEPV